MREFFRNKSFASCVVALTLFSIFGCARRGASPDEVFLQFREALLESDLPTLNELVSRNSIQYINRLQEWVILGDRDGIRDLEPFDRFLVLKMRAHLHFLEEGDWLAWLESKGDSAVDELNVMSLNLFQNDFDDFVIIRVDTIGRTAGAVLRYNRSTYPTRLRFRDENGWKIDLIDFLRDEFERSVARYRSDRYEGQDPIDAFLREELGGLFSLDLYAPRISKR